MIDLREPGTTVPAPPVAAEDVATLFRSLDLDEALSATTEVFLEVSEASACGIWLLDEDELRPAAAATAEGGAAEGFAGGRPTSSPAAWSAVLGGRAVVTDGPRDVALAPRADAGPLLLVPLVRDARPLGVVALAAPGSLPPRALERVGAHAGAALANAREWTRQQSRLADLERSAERLGVLHDLDAALVEEDPSGALVARVNVLLRDRGPEVDGLAWRNRDLAQRLGGTTTGPEERALLREEARFTTLPGGRLALPLYLGDRPAGTIRVRGVDPAGGGLEVLETLAAGVAEVAHRILLRASVEEAARTRALAAERERIAADLHDTAGQLFVAIQLLARREAEKLPPDAPGTERFRRLAELADQGKWEIDQVIDALAFAPAARRGLVAAIKSLATTFRSDSGLDVIVDVSGRPVRLPASAERALYRVVHESLANAWRHARCSVVRIALGFEKSSVRLTVTDDGIGLTEAIPDRGRVGTHGMRRAVTEVGGVFRIRNARPRGVLVEAELPRDVT